VSKRVTQPVLLAGRAGQAPATVLEAAALADRQLTVDRERTARFPDLFVRKLQRMSATPLGFLRGAAPLFYELLAARPDLADGPPGDGWIVGDLHLENFGAYRPDAPGRLVKASTEEPPSKKQRPVVFDLNDFDDTTIGPWRLDLLRLSTSLLLAGRELGASGIVALELCDRLLGAWARSAFDGAGKPEPPAPVAALIEQVRLRPRTELLDARTRANGGKRHFVRGPRYADLAPEVLAAVPRAFEGYVASLPEPDRPAAASLEILDAVLRIAGTGSLGGLRVAILVRGKGPPDGQWIFDLKEQGVPSGATLSPAPALAPAERVATGFRACVERLPRMVGTTELAGLSMFGRRLAPQDDKLNLRRLRGADLPALATYLGALLGHAHARGATKPPTRWSKADLAALREHAVTLAGIHEAVYLALCSRMRDLLP
jgi:uncharacterized protein (DUF2252 family)